MSVLALQEAQHVVSGLVWLYGLPFGAVMLVVAISVARQLYRGSRESLAGRRRAHRVLTSLLVLLWAVASVRAATERRPFAPNELRSASAVAPMCGDLSARVRAPEYLASTSSVAREYELRTRPDAGSDDRLFRTVSGPAGRLAWSSGPTATRLVFPPDTAAGDVGEPRASMRMTRTIEDAVATRDGFVVFDDYERELTFLDESGAEIARHRVALDGDFVFALGADGDRVYLTASSRWDPAAAVMAFDASGLVGRPWRIVTSAGERPIASYVRGSHLCVPFARGNEPDIEYRAAVVDLRRRALVAPSAIEHVLAQPETYGLLSLLLGLVFSLWVAARALRTARLFGRAEAGDVAAGTMSAIEPGPRFRLTTDDGTFDVDASNALFCDEPEEGAHCQVLLDDIGAPDTASYRTPMRARAKATLVIVGTGGPAELAGARHRDSVRRALSLGWSLLILALPALFNWAALPF